MEEISSRIAKETIDKNKDIFHLLIYGFGGIIFENQFKEISKIKNNKFFKFLEEQKYIKITYLGSNKVITARNKLYNYFGLEYKTVKISWKRVLHSSLLAEYIIRCHSADERYIKKFLHTGTISFYAPEDALNLMTRVQAHAEEKALNTKYLSSSINDLKTKLDFIKQKCKGNKTKLEKSVASKYNKDILALKDSCIFIMGVGFDGNDYVFDVAIYAHSLRFDRLIKQINLADSSIRYAFFGLPIKIDITLYSHFEENEAYTTRIKEYLISEEYPNNVDFMFFNTKKKLFSGIDIDNLL
ncbi:MAG: hypothetical protein J6C17_00700 [Clostridia bacterium]|nr:hypothetical protein [Clostridia bacterium]